MKTKLFLLSLMAIMLAACNTNEPTKKYVGVWEPVRYEDCDIFVITSDSIKAVQNETGLEHYQTHYEVLNDSVARLERSRTGASVVFEEVAMYIDKEGYLIIRPFTTGSPLSLEYPNYAWLKLRKK